MSKPHFGDRLGDREDRDCVGFCLGDCEDQDGCTPMKWAPKDIRRMEK